MKSNSLRLILLVLIISVGSFVAALLQTQAKLETSLATILWGAVFFTEGYFFCIVTHMWRTTEKIEEIVKEHFEEAKKSAQMAAAPYRWN